MIISFKFLSIETFHIQWNSILTQMAIIRDQVGEALMAKERVRDGLFKVGRPMITMKVSLCCRRVRSVFKGKQTSRAGPTLGKRLLRRSMALEILKGHPNPKLLCATRCRARHIM